MTPEGSDPVSVKLIGASPFAVTAKVPAVFSANVVDAPEVMDGPVAVTVKVKAWVAVLRVGVGRRDGDRVAAGGPEGRRAGQGAVGCPGSHPKAGSRTS